MQTAFATHIFYDGSQLRSGWIAGKFGLSGDAIVAFTGGCDVTPEHMLDLEDLAARDSIRASLMLHFIVEHFGIDLPLAVARQRLLACLVREILTERYQAVNLTRDGDDLFIGDRKLSISIASLSPTSGLIHFAVNLDPTGAPVPAVGLQELGIEETGFARLVQGAYIAEIASCEHAAGKVRPAR
jgi:uncharacterized protein